MAAHDDKISTNRRNLFKALSTAPVVMTLRPGSAFASESAFQCLAKIRRDVSVPPGPVAAPVDNLLYADLDYWLIDEESRIKVDGVAVSTDGLTLPYPIPFLVVRMPAAQGGGMYATSGQIVGDEANGVLFETPHEIDAGTGELVLKNSDGEVCIRADVTQGYFALVGVSAAGGGLTEDGQFSEIGFFPQHPIVTIGGDPGSNQGITGTCMASLDNAGRYTPLSNG